MERDTILVFGGSGYVGSRICEEAILNGFKVVSITRSGSKPSWAINKEWSKNVTWEKGDALSTDSLQTYFNNNNNGNNVRGVVAAIGAFHYNQDIMEKVNGDTTVNICNLSKRYNVMYSLHS